MFKRIRHLGRGVSILLRDALARADAASRPPMVSPIVMTPIGPAIGLDGQAMLLGLTDWSVDWPPAIKLARLHAAITARRGK